MPLKDPTKKITVNVDRNLHTKIKSQLDKENQGKDISKFYDRGAAMLYELEYGKKEGKK